ncbi:MAG: translocation and assembly module TamA [Gammaproteobacteria bacterium]
MIRTFFCASARGLLSSMLFALGVLALGGCSSPKEHGSSLAIVAPNSGVPYSAQLSGAADKDLTELLEKSLKLFSLAHRKPASRARLRRRAEADIETALAVLRSEGYYNGVASFAIAVAPAAVPAAQFGDERDDNSEPAAPTAVVPAAANAIDEGPFSVTVNIEPGQRFKLARMSIEPAVTAQGLTVATAEILGIDEGAFARAADIVDAESRVVAHLAERGYAYAKFEGHTVTADMAQHALTVVGRVAPGPRVRFGAMRFEGLRSVQAPYLQSYQPWQDEALYSRSALERLQTSLFATSLFDSVSVQPATLAEAAAAAVQIAGHAPNESASEHAKQAAATDSAEVRVPITVIATEAKHRSVGAGARFSTNDGPEVTAFFEHRNMFGANETGRATLLGGLRRQELSLSIRKPQFWQQPNVLFGSFVVGHEDSDAFEERAVTFLLGMERQWNKRLTVSAGLSLEVSQIDDNLDGNFDVAQLAGVPLTARYDASNSLFDPTRGYRLGATVTPYVGTFRSNALMFSSMDLAAALYVPIDSARRYVFAARGRAATLVGAERDALPSTKRLYSGGGGSVRGYQTRFIGPLDARDDPLGGRSVLEAGVEMRIRIGENLGIVPFIDAGTVSSEIFPDFSEDVQIGAGLGVRYHTIIGPIRADLAVPINRREADNLFEFYISIGQAF